jgi:hypothetical protein
MKEEFNKDMENLRKKNQTETLEIKIPKSNKKYRGKPLQQTKQVEEGSQDLKTK